MNDVFIIGGGPSGVSAALYLKRDNYNVTVVTNNNSVLKKAPMIDNYYGVKSLNGEDLYKIGIEQLKEIGVTVLEEEVTRIEKYEDFKIHTDKNIYDSKIVIIATGITRSNPKISNIMNYEGKGVSYCATCDGFFFRNKKIGVVGNSNYAYEEAKHLMQISTDITLFTNGEELKRDFSDLNIKINTSKITSIYGENKVEGVTIDNENIPLDALFIAVGVASGSSFSKTLGIDMEGNYIKVNPDFMTNVEGLYAIGDIVGGVLQIGKAVADGIIASRVINKVLREKQKAIDN